MIRYQITYIDKVNCAPKTEVIAIENDTPLWESLKEFTEDFGGTPTILQIFPIPTAVFYT